MMHCRRSNVEDNPFLRKMLFEAVFWSRSEEERPSLDQGLSYDYTKHILQDFGNRKGDLGVIVEVDGQRAGGAFIRYWNDQVNLRGYLNEDIPVLVIGVAKVYRRQGVGSLLMQSLKSIAKEQDIGQISLCVTKNNIAYDLYTKEGFKIIEEIDSSYNMLWKA